ncbi:S-layer homology domain-containing protein [Tissierella praeacuta]|uniref:S-layer homology domain-containing protein n=1 Tax=Tissierella praeacuta TaxID=43131 RepID=UPI00333E2A81
MKKILSLFIVLTIVVSTGTISFGQASDYENSWAKNEINYMREKGIIGGYQDGTFRPTNNMSKSEFYKVINGLMGYTEKDEIKFKDVTTADWYYEEVQKGLKAKYILSSEKLNARENITREEVARILSVVFNIEEDTSAAVEFTDNALFSKELRGVIGGLKKNNFINGLPDGSFNPKGDITRAEVVKILHNISGEIVNAAGTISKNINTNLVINASDVILKDITIEGNLYLTEGIGEGNITLDNVVVKGEVRINGGGTNGIVIKNSKLNKVVADKQQGLVRVSFENTTAKEIKTANKVKLELTNGTQIESVELDGKVEISLEKGVSINRLDIVSKDVTVESKGIIETVAAKEKIKLNGETIEANTKVKVKDGKIEKLKSDSTKSDDSSKSGSSDNKTKPEVPSEESIVSKYRTKLEELQANVNKELDSLVSQAQKEIKEGKSLKQIYKTYEPKARALESNTDTAVSSIVSDLESELKSNGYDPKSLPDLYAEYEKAKGEYEIKIEL